MLDVLPLSTCCCFSALSDNRGARTPESTIWLTRADLILAGKSHNSNLHSKGKLITLPSHSPILFLHFSWDRSSKGMSRDARYFWGSVWAQMFTSFGPRTIVWLAYIFLLERPGSFLIVERVENKQSVIAGPPSNENMLENFRRGRDDS
jgi:hypothetical protein